MKKMLLIAFLMFVGFAPHVFAQGFVPIAPIPNLTQGVTANSAGLANFFNNLYKYLIGLAAVLAIIEIIWGGLEISTKDSVSKQSDGKVRIQQALFGLVLVLSPVLVFSIINPSILNLSLNLDPIKLDTPAGTSGGTGNTATAPTTTTTASGCKVTGTFFKQASCPNQSSAQAFVASCPNSGKVASCQTEISSGCADKVVLATCDSAASPPYVFLDVSNAYIPVDLFSDYQPLVSSNADANNGSDAVQFAATCTQDGGMTCLSGSFLSVSCTYTTPQSTTHSNKCYTATLTCENSSFINKLSLCSSGPSWSPIK